MGEQEYKQSLIKGSYNNLEIMPRQDEIASIPRVDFCPGYNKRLYPLAASITPDFLRDFSFSFKGDTFALRETDSQVVMYHDSPNSGNNGTNRMMPPASPSPEPSSEVGQELQDNDPQMVSQAMPMIFHNVISRKRSSDSQGDLVTPAAKKPLCRPAFMNEERSCPGLHPPVEVSSDSADIITSVMDENSIAFPAAATTATATAITATATTTTAATTTTTAATTAAAAMSTPSSTGASEAAVPTPSSTQQMDYDRDSPHMSLPSPSVSPVGTDPRTEPLQHCSSNEKTKNTLVSAFDMIENFESLPDKMKTYIMCKLLKFCDRSTLTTLSTIIDPALRCDLLTLLPLELSYNIISYLDFRSLCNAAQVSKAWKDIVDSSEWIWKDLLERDELHLEPGDLRRAKNEQWGYTGWGSSNSTLSASSSSSSSTLSSLSTIATTISSSSSSPPSLALSSKLSDSCPSSIMSLDLSRSSNPVPTPVPTPRFSISDPYIKQTQMAPSFTRPSSLVPKLDINVYKAIYRRKYLIRKNWMNPNSTPRRLSIKSHKHYVVTCLQFDDERIITGSEDHTICVYETETGKLMHRFEGHDGGVWALKYINKRTLISGSTDRTVRVWDIEKAVCTHIFYGHVSTVRCMDVLEPVPIANEAGQTQMFPKFPIIVTGSRDATLRMWKLPQPDDPWLNEPLDSSRPRHDPFLLRSLRGHTDSVRSISGYGDTLVSGSYDTTVRVWKTSTGECKWKLTGHEQRVYSALLDHKRNRCISGSMDWSVKVWCIETGSLLYTLGGHTSLVGLLDLNRTTLVSAAADSTLRVWDPESGSSIHHLQGHQGAITCFQHDDNKVVSGSPKTLKLWNIKTGKLVRNLLTDLTDLWQVCFDQRRCAAAVKRGEDIYIEVIDFDYDPASPPPNAPVVVVPSHSQLDDSSHIRAGSSHSSRRINHIRPELLERRREARRRETHEVREVHSDPEVIEIHSEDRSELRTNHPEVLYTRSQTRPSEAPHLLDPENNDL